MRFAVFLFVLLIAGRAPAAESALFTTARDTVSLVSETNSVAADKPVRLGLRMRMAPGWHTYWSNPGDAGAPATLDITGATIGPIVYPAPERLREGPFTSFAYTGEVLLPVTITGSRARTLSVDAHATWLVCATICVPEEARFHLDLPSGGGSPSAEAALFATADSRTPRVSPFTAHITPQGVLWLDAVGLKLRSAVFFPETAGTIDQDAAQTLQSTDKIIRLALKPLKPLDALSGVLVLTDAGGETASLYIHATKLALPANEAATPGLMQALLLAFAGGLILNLMPCVLPVLAIKALSLARLSGAARNHVRREAAMYTVGVLVAFCTIGAVTLGARALGGDAGWGVQFQSPVFTAAMALLLFTIGLNMSGVFVVGGRLAGTGQTLAARGSFFTGLLAVIVATPCTAPFMGAALAAALALPPFAGMLVFAALGFGLAAPYAALALNPRAAMLLPRPGVWMDILKHVLAFPMYAAALWLVWVVSQLVDAAGLATMFGAVLLTGFAAWSYGAGQLRDRARLLNGAAIASVAGLCALLVSLGAVPRAAAARGPASADGSEPFSAEKLAMLRAAHRPVFVDMTAAWCVTCLVNERVALSPASVRDAFTRHHVALLKGDWTRQDAGITAYLREHGRSGVPLYIYYPASGEPEVLPQILTATLVVAKLE